MTIETQTTKEKLRLFGNLAKNRGEAAGPPGWTVRICKTTNTYYSFPLLAAIKSRLHFKNLRQLIEMVTNGMV